MLNKDRLSKLLNILLTHRIDGCLMAPATDVEYLAGIKTTICERFQGLCVLANGNWFAISPSLYYEEWREGLGEDAHIYAWSDNDDVRDIFERAAKDYKLMGKTIAINDGIRGVDLLDIKTAMDSNFINGNNIFEELRIIKDQNEMEYMTKAAQIADNAYEIVREYIRPGMMEKEISDKLKELLIELGGDELSFEPIVASGPNSSKPHYNGGNRVIEEQDLIILDYGCRYGGYCSDITRTVFVGEPTKEQKKAYEIVLRANIEAEKAVKEGIRAEEIDGIAREVISREGYGEYFITRTGHGIGMAVHEAPYIKAGNKRVLKAGMAFSIEPGIYIPGKFGIRIEDIVIVNRDEVCILNKAEK